MGRGTRVEGPVAFMPSDGRFLGSRDLRGLPVGVDGIRMPIRVVDVMEFPPGEKINGKTLKKAFWSVSFERPPNLWLRAPWDSKPKNSGGWQRSKKEWKVGPEVTMRVTFRLGDNALDWLGQVIPLRLEVTQFGRDDVWGIRPVPLPFEADPQARRRAMVEIANGTYDPPGIARSDPAPVAPPPETPQPSHDDVEPPEGWKSGDGPDKESHGQQE